MSAMPSLTREALFVWSHSRSPMSIFNRSSLQMNRWTWCPRSSLVSSPKFPKRRSLRIVQRRCWIRRFLNPLMDSVNCQVWPSLIVIYWKDLRVSGAVSSSSTAIAQINRYFTTLEFSNFNLDDSDEKYYEDCFLVLWRADYSNESS